MLKCLPSPPLCIDRADRLISPSSPQTESRRENMEVLLDSGINFIIYLQKSWTGWQNEILFLSKVGDPRNSFLIYFPVVYHLNHNLGVSVLWTAIFSEWMNLVLKW